MENNISDVLKIATGNNTSNIFELQAFRYFLLSTCRFWETTAEGDIWHYQVRVRPGDAVPYPLWVVFDWLRGRPVPPEWGSPPKELKALFQEFSDNIAASDRCIQKIFKGVQTDAPYIATWRIVDKLHKYFIKQGMDDFEALGQAWEIIGDESDLSYTVGGGYVEKN